MKPEKNKSSRKTLTVPARGAQSKRISVSLAEVSGTLKGSSGGTRNRVKYRQRRKTGKIPKGGFLR